MPGRHRASIGRCRAAAIFERQLLIPEADGWSVAVTLLFASALLAELVPAATENAWARFVRPWCGTPRYTFAAENHCQRKWSSPTANRSLDRKARDGFVLAAGTRPRQLGEQPPIDAELSDNGYRFEFPPQIEAGPLSLRVGDATAQVEVEAETATRAYLDHG